MKELSIIVLFATISIFSASAMEINDEKSDPANELKELYKIQLDQSESLFDHYDVNEIDPFSTETFSDLIKEAKRNKTSLIIARGLQSIDVAGKQKKFIKTYEAVGLFRHLFGPNFISPKKHRANLSEHEQINFKKTDPLNRQPLLGVINLFSIDNNEQTGTYIGSDLQLHVNQDSEKAKIITDALLSTISNEILIDEYFANAKKLFNLASNSNDIDESNALYRRAVEYFIILELKLDSLQQKRSDLADIQQYLGKIYFEGKGGIEKNIERGFEYLKDVADQDDDLSIKAIAQFNLGIIYLRRLGGIKEDVEQAITYLKVVASQDVNLFMKAEAQFNLAMIYFYGKDSVDKNIKKAIEYLKATANQNNNLSKKAEAQFALGAIYCDGKDWIDKNIELGLEYLKYVANQDDNQKIKSYAQAKLNEIQ